MRITSNRTTNKCLISTENGSKIGPQIIKNNEVTGKKKVTETACDTGPQKNVADREKNYKKNFNRERPTTTLTIMACTKKMRP